MSGLGWGGVGLGGGDDGDSPWGKPDETPAWAGGTDGDDGGEIELGEPTRVVEDAPAPTGKDPATGQDLPAWARASASGAAEVEAAVEGEAPAKEKKKGWFGGGKGKEAAPAVSVEVAISEDLKKRMQELDAREGKLKALEAQLQAGGATLKPVNWPRCLPRLRIAIDEDVAAEMTGLVKAGYVAWLLSIAGYVWNFICILFLVFVSGQSGVGFGSFFLGTLMSILGLLCSYWFWFKALYKCGELYLDANYMWYHLWANLAIHVAWCAWTFVGAPLPGASFVAGFFRMIKAFQMGGGYGVFTGVLCIINMAIWGLNFFLSVYVWSWSVHQYRRNTAERETRALQNRGSGVNVFGGFGTNSVLDNGLKKMFA